MYPYLVNIASQFIFLVLVVMLGVVLHRFTGRKRLLAFFNVEKSKRLVVYLSHLRIRSGGSIGVDEVPRSFGEGAIPLYEANMIPFVQRLFNFVVPGLNSQPGFLKWLLVSDVLVEVLPSPLSLLDVERRCTFVAVGSPGYNQASRRIEQDLGALAKFTGDNSAIQLKDTPALTDLRSAFVQRVVDQNTGQVAFYLAGASSLATTAAFYFLCNRWQYLYKRFASAAPFCVVLRVPGTDPRVQEIVFERGTDA